MSDVIGNLPSLNGLKAFEVAARHLNFRLAAEELGVTQGAVAQQVRGLEAQLGMNLFERLPRTLALTSEGRRYIADIRRAFEIIARATGELKPQAIKLTISTTPTFASKWLIPRLPDFTALHPDLDLHILAVERLSNFQVDGVDLAVRYGRPPFGPGLNAELLFEQEIVAVCSPLLLAGRPAPRTGEELAAYPLLHDAHNFWPEFVERYFANSKSPYFKGISFSQTSHAIEAAIAGQGIALANRGFVADDLEKGRLQRVFEGTLRGPSDFYLVWPRYRKSPALDTVIDWLLIEAQKQG
ncbi:LysR family glycine cleavage system transcriptional activator [Rhizobium sp. BK529]|uniref:transcriptional regulator GcvA n=1 Tax=unclassified Rhizobium TaxID=2613769 RepID=UPI001052B76D|nr:MULTISPECIES: transcriptional regulator GcvA [unclassified Rhizobium]MBB3590511.1 LysR family glycine cleavage system transcriptional activator [Rhizobium sp. BK529]TCS05200.1 LysR family glycine cleavage system transcriptional activator [Rhizobium sp. BK418]